MPIVGLTRREDVTPKFPDLGKLRKGGPKTDPKRPGPDLDHWRFTSERPEVLAAFVTAYTDVPKIIEAYLPFPTVEENFSTWMEEYDAGGLRHRCDGQTMSRWRVADGTYRDEGTQPCPYFAGTKTRTKENPGCKQVGRLYLIIPQLIRAGYVGFVTCETHSINDLISITACLVDAEKKAGKLNGILFNLLRVKQTISTPAWKEEDKAAGKRNRTVKDLVKIVPAAEWVLARLQVEAEQQMALASGKLELTAHAKTTTEDAFGEADEEEDDLDEWSEDERPGLPDADENAGDIVESEATEVEPPPAAPSELEPPKAITDSQRGAIRDIAKRLYPTKQAGADYLRWLQAQYQVSEPKELTAVQADDVIARLREIEAKHGAEGVG